MFIRNSSISPAEQQPADFDGFRERWIQLTRSSPTGPAEQEDGGSLVGHKMSVHTASWIEISCRFVPDSPKVEHPVEVVVCETPAQLSPTSHDDLGLKNDDTC